ncbi:MAG: tRNA (adenosine(37)-N6)-dimethylallyltransferase MiaA [Solirubrobacterales bacterium]
MIALFGPTGVGKTEVAIALAELLRARGEDPIAVSADAIAVYEGLDVLAAKPASERLEHRLLSCVPIDEEFSAGRFAALAHAEIDDLLARGRTPIVVGGTGLYLRAALTELDLRPPPPRDLREGLERELAQVGPDALHGRLSPATAATVHPHDRKRIVRALELELGGTPPHPASEQLWSEELRRPAALFGLVMDREALAARIESRAGEMLAGGAVEEVERALERGASRTARKALGFEEIAAHLAGEASLEDVRERIERGHRAYVRRQLTWMRKLSGVEIIDRTALSAREVAERILA